MKYRVWFDITVGSRSDGAAKKLFEVILDKVLKLFPREFNSWNFSFIEECKEENFKEPILPHKEIN